MSGIFDSLRVMLVLLGAFLGAGLTSGEEARAFFAVYGTSGLISSAIAGTFLALVGMRLFALRRVCDCPDALFRLLFGSYAPLVHLGTLLFYAAVLSAMLSGADEIAHLVGLPYEAGTMLCTLFLFALSHPSASPMRANLRLIPCVLLALTAVTVYSLVYHFALIDAPLSTLESLSPACDTHAPRAYISALSYVSYNLLLTLPALFALRCTAMRAIVCGSVLAGAMLSLLLVALLAVIALHDTALPMILLSVAEMQHDLCFYAYTAVVSLALITSALSALVGASDALIPYFGRLRLPLTLAFCLAVSRLGFDTLIGSLLPALSVLSILFTLRLLLPVRADNRRR